MAHKLKIKRKDGLGYWELPHMDEEYIDELTGGEHTDLHHHDSRYYTETEIDARWSTHLAAADPHSPYLLIDGSKAMTGQLTFLDVLDVRMGIENQQTMDWFIDEDDLIANSGFNIYVDGNITANKVFSITANSGAFFCNFQVIDHYLQVIGDEGDDGLFYLYADDGDDQDDWWRIRAGDDGLFAIQNYDGGWVDWLTIDPTAKALVVPNDHYYGIKNTGGAVKNMLYLTASNIAYLSHADFATNLQGSTVTIRANSQDALTIDTSQNVDIPNGTFTVGSTVDVDSILDQDDFYSDSNTALATQQSIKAYVDTETVALDGTRAMTGALTINANYMRLQAASGGSAKVEIVGDDGEDNADFWRIESATDNKLNFANYGSGAWVDKMELDTDGNMEIAGTWDLGAVLTVNETYQGKTILVDVDDSGVVFGHVLASAADFNYDRADADAAANCVGLVMALEAGNGSDKKVLVEGMVCDTDWAWTNGYIYLSTTAGNLTQTAPSGTGDQVVALGWALSADTMYFKPSLVLVEVA